MSASIVFGGDQIFSHFSLSKSPTLQKKVSVCAAFGGNPGDVPIARHQWSVERRLPH